MNNLFSAGPKVSNTALADALKGFEVKAADLSEERKPRQIRRGGGLYGRPKGNLSSASSPVTKSGVVIEVKNTPSNVSSAHSSLDEYPEGNIALSKLFGDKEKLLLSLRELLQKHERAVCTFFQQEKRGAGGVTRSYLSFRVIVRPGDRVALCVLGGTRWLLDRFKDAPEIFLDELHGHREAPKDREAATRTLRLILAGVRSAMSDAMRQKKGKR